MTAFRMAVRAGVGLTLLIWWLPAILVALAALLLDRARAAGTLLLVDALRAAGCRRAARAVCVAALRRCRRRQAALGRQR